MERGSVLMKPIFSPRLCCWSPCWLWTNSWSPMDLSWPVCEGEWDCLPLPGGFRAKGEMCFRKDCAWCHKIGKKIGSFRASGRGRHGLSRDWMCRVSSSWGLTQIWPCSLCCLYSFVKHLSGQQDFSDGSVVQQKPLFRDVGFLS